MKLGALLDQNANGPHIAREVLQNLYHSGIEGYVNAVTLGNNWAVLFNGVIGGQINYVEGEIFPKGIDLRRILNLIIAETQIHIFPWSSKVEKDMRFYCHLGINDELPKEGIYRQNGTTLDMILHPNQNPAVVNVINGPSKLRHSIFTQPIEEVREGIARISMGYQVVNPGINFFLGDFNPYLITVGDSLFIKWYAHDENGKVIGYKKETLNHRLFPNTMTARKLELHAKDLANQISEDYAVPVDIYKMK